MPSWIRTTINWNTISVLSKMVNWIKDYSNLFWVFTCRNVLIVVKEQLYLYDIVSPLSNVPSISTSCWVREKAGYYFYWKYWFNLKLLCLFIPPIKFTSFDFFKCSRSSHSSCPFYMKFTSQAYSLETWDRWYFLLFWQKWPIPLVNETIYFLFFRISNNLYLYDVWIRYSPCRIS